MNNNEIVITSAYRTAIGSFGKSLKNTESFDLGSKVIQTTIEKLKLKKNEIDEIIIRPSSNWCLRSKSC